MVGEIRVFLVHRGVRGDLADISGLDRPIGMIPLSPPHPRRPLPRPTVSYRLPQRLLLGGPLFSPTVLPHTLSTSYLPRIFAAPLAFLGYHSTRLALSNGIPFVQIGAAVVEEFEFLWVKVSRAGFANISGRGYCSATFPSPHPPYYAVTSHTPYLPHFEAEPLAFRGCGTTR
ncbi:hypothetical protein PISMIDRAFT_687127 [Pisolithus microcarpus 441]|uniref:Uncharacterized protein n=1 Tax=Pisolithus microcarpus 441 TaxID=765257 RepID=A0A0C9YG78_9AGAM|nr:hypothetical protein BKA83DRAFT_687127 [Pisolithus microcarpus]KIK15621.1 hypothetical protein PISMIDRAFT_687127 [Pisolithus microcarpus 441]